MGIVSPNGIGVWGGSTSLVSPRRGGGGGGLGIDAYVKAMLHLDGANGGTTFTDEIGVLTWGRSGSATIATYTGQKKFGTASVYFDGTGDYLLAQPADESYLSFGTQDFTIDVQLRSDVAISNHYVCGQYDSGTNWWFVAFEAGQVRFKYIAGGTTVANYISTDASLIASQWYHLAVVRSGPVMKMFIEGTPLTLTETTAVGGNNLSLAMNAYTTLGNYTSVGGGWNGYMDEYRISKGIARWTTTFTPPIAPYA